MGALARQGVTRRAWLGPFIYSRIEPAVCSALEVEFCPCKRVLSQVGKVGSTMSAPVHRIAAAGFAAGTNDLVRAAQRRIDSQTDHDYNAA